MKNFFAKLLSKPKLIIPVFAVIAIIIVVLNFNKIGQPPIIPNNITISSPSSIVTSVGNVSLSFTKSGRVASVAIKSGDAVHTGEVLATLSAPDAEGAISQAKGALDLAQAQYASINLDYANTKKQQDLIVANTYQTMLSSSLQAVPNIQDQNIPIISGTYTCDKEGSYKIQPYSSNDGNSGFSFNYSGLETGIGLVKFNNPVPLGNCGLQVTFPKFANFNSLVIWTVAIPNTQSPVYLTNSNNYNLAINTRDKTLENLAQQIGTGGSSSVAQAQIDAAEGAYQSALGAYQNNVITSPINGIITFIDTDLKIGQTVTAGKSIISISAK